MKGRVGSIYSKRSVVHSVVPLGDGRVHIQLAEPIINPRAQLWLMVMLGNRRGNQIITNAGKIVGLVVWPETWVDVLQNLGAPRKVIRQFIELSASGE